MKLTRDLSAEVPAPCCKFAPDFIRTIGSGSFFADFGKVVGRIAPYDSLLFFLYRPDAAPVLMAQFGVSDKFQRGLNNYLDHTYLLNPVYQAFKSSVPSGVYSMSDLMPDGYGDLIGAVEFEVKIDDRETIGYLTPGWPKHTEELLLLINLPDGSMVELTILRQRAVGFSDQEFADISQVFATASAVFHKHWELVNQDFSAHVGQPSLDSSFVDFGADVLTEREKEVVKLVLTGHSSESISLRLGTSVATIKTHRRNIYAKLKIGSQAELFFRFIGFLTTRRSS
ncbi:MAG: helix-turn-helix transcriptional regulator [Rhodobacteraceae bacterium]|nr:MAG: helix-turn-helix transcriptional regulator [Paracoccaceae bacterium]